MINIKLPRYATIHLPIHQFIDIWVISTFTKIYVILL